jgi:hypothetical protein
MPNTPSNKRQKQTAFATPTSAKTAVFEIDFEATSQKWSPHRLERTEKKVRSLQDGNLRGGDFVLDVTGGATTLSFLFEKDSKVYGVTAGHLADIDDPIFVFFYSEPTQNDHDNGSSYDILEIGEVVSKDFPTDSLIFEITNPYMKNRLALLKIAPDSGLGERALQIPEPNPLTEPPRIGTKVVVYGAMRRGEHGVVRTPAKAENGYVSKKSDVGISFPDGGSKPMTDWGDCGALYLDAQGCPIAMHHCLAGDSVPFESFGIPFPAIMAKHPLLGGDERQRHEDHQAGRSRPVRAAGMVENRGIARFKTKVFSMDTERPERRDIAQFNIRVGKWMDVER